MADPDKMWRLVKNLSSKRKPVKPVLPTSIVWPLWMLLTMVMVGLQVELTGPLRPGWLNQVQSSPHFLLECLLGFLIFVAASYKAFDHSIPHIKNYWDTGWWWGPVLLILLLTSIGIGFWNPALEVSMVGKRMGCENQTLLFSLLPVFLAIFLIRRRAALEPMKTGLLIGLACGILPGISMHIACMYEPFHVLTHHMLPVLVVSLGFGFLARWILLA